MKRDSRLSGVLHAILHMAEAAAPLTSEQLAKHMDANPVVIRRIMAGLREAGFVSSSKGHGGGWVLARPLEDISLRDVYEAIGAPAPFAIGNRNESPGCLVEKAVNAALDDAFREAEAILIARLGAVTLARLFEDFHRRFQAYKEERSHVPL
ncbi:Rrf2 family transcriptional regulator [Rhizobium sp. FKL33]|uniref:Rrf2 family transcriptional regulator n=1 Tax=Rhizobium sp. FKL33 TaxID=2562307 RepID=UPI0010C0F77C|nr:Rrf2 family transcriptional regulator [Rhizobium sp. FKL33]